MTASIWVPATWTQGLVLIWWALYWLNYLPSLLHWFLKISQLICFLCTGTLSARMSVYHMCAWPPQRPEKGGTAIPDGCEQPCGCWVPSTPWEQQYSSGVRLTTGPSFQSLYFSYFIFSLCLHLGFFFIVSIFYLLLSLFFCSCFSRPG